MACPKKSLLILTRAVFQRAKECLYTSSTAAALAPTGRGRERQPSKLDEDAMPLPPNVKDVFVDGEVREKRTMRKKLERWALSGGADTGEASTVAAQIRGKLQSQANADKGEEQETTKKKSGDLRYQTRDFSRLSTNVIAKILRDRIIYNEGDIVALDKPHGLPIHGGPGVRHSIDSLLPQLAHMLNKTKGGDIQDLHIIHRLDKDTTGVMLLAKTEMTARVLHEMFKKRQMAKKYWVITVGIPSPKEGIIDMPMMEKEIDGKHRMVVKPDIGDVYPESWGLKPKRRNVGSHEAITKYRVLSEHGNCALVQLEPETGVKHQIRVHLAQGLGCPILGDHKYSHHDRLAPQRLPAGMLHALRITQPKARTVPMHLHARQLIIPETFNKQNIFLSTRVPWFFSDNMKKLRLKYDP